MKSKVIVGMAACGALLAMSQSAMAHPGHGIGTGFAAGVAHPLSGMDHVAAMAAVGLCAAQMGRRAMWMLPAAFVGALVGGAMMAGGSLPMMEQAIGLSLLVLGLMVISGQRMALPVATGLVAMFGVFHGYAHGAELGAAASTCAGFVTASVGLIAVGMGVGVVLRRLERIGNVARA